MGSKDEQDGRRTGEGESHENGGGDGISLDDHHDGSDDGQEPENVEEHVANKSVHECESS